MKNQLLSTSLTSARLKIAGLIAAVCFAVIPSFSNAATVSFGVTFGNPPSGGGFCVGKGVCRESLDASDASAVIVSFVLNESNPNILMMRFSMSELSAKQPDKVSSFTDPSGYAFDAPYMLNKSVFEPLRLLPGASIAAGMKYTVSITDDLVTVYVPYSHAN